MVMKVGIITIMDYTNYGNRLQNYALYYFLKSKFDCQAVTLTSYAQRPYYNGNYVAWLKDQIAKKMCMFPSIAEKRFGSNITRWANFQKWSKKIPTINYYQCEQLPCSLNDQYECFFVGSDQVWNYHFSSSRFDDFFLKFVDNKKKVSISASFGVDKIPDEWKKIYYDGLKDFAYISVREDAGQSIVKELLGKNVPVLLDPVMMLSPEEWLRVSKKPRVDCSKPYILKYYLGCEAEEDKIDIWAQENGYEIYELLNEKIPELYSAGPGEFITLINNAALICSDSFHCIAFSIIFSKPFIVYDRRGKDTYMSSRLDTLLNKFGFRGRWKHLLKEEEYLACNYEFVKEQLQIEQQKFKDYISTVLKKVDNDA
mgnify:CR=1 FL=1